MPSAVTVSEHPATVNVVQRSVHPVFTAGIGSLYNHGEDVLMTLQLRDSSGNLLQNIGHRVKICVLLATKKMFFLNIFLQHFHFSI